MSSVVTSPFSYISLSQPAPHKIINVVCGHLINGGAKTPALLRYLPTLHHQHIAYVGTVYGSGAWAVAEACAQLGLTCTLFIAKSDYSPAWLPALTKTGAKINWCDPLPVATLHTRINTEHPELHNLPLGFDTPDFVKAMANVMKEALPIPPVELWLPALSGVLARSACLAFPETAIHAVAAAKQFGDMGRAMAHIAPEKFHQAARTPPPYPACPFSDAKVWQFASKMAVSNAFIWNVSS